MCDCPSSQRASGQVISRIPKGPCLPPFRNIENNIGQKVGLGDKDGDLL